MTYNEALAERVRSELTGITRLVEKKMFGGICFLLNGNMCVGVWKNSLIARLGIEQGAEALREPHVKKMDITGKPMKGWVLIEPDGVEDDDGSSAQRAQKVHLPRSRVAVRIWSRSEKLSAPFASNFFSPTSPPGPASEATHREWSADEGDSRE